MSSSDVIVIGGGLVGTAVAYGLSQLGKRITVLDEGDDVFRASRGNFGLIWVHGKGRGVPHYARWTRESARQWPTLAARLHADTGIDVQARQTGGFNLCFSEAELEARGERLGAAATRLSRRALMIRRIASGQSLLARPTTRRRSSSRSLAAVRRPSSACIEDRRRIVLTSRAIFKDQP